MFKSGLSRLCKRFTKSEAGNMALMTAFGSVFLIGGLAVAIDMTRGINARTNLADATDAIALMLAKGDYATTAEMEAAAQTYLVLHYPGDEGSRLKIVEIEKNGDAVSVLLANNVDTHFSGLFNTTDLDVTAKAEAIYAEKEMDIALVLDTTLSMQGSKMTSLKGAANDMVDTIDGYKNAKVRMSVVPFSNYVNVGLSRRNAPWLRVDPDSSTTTNECRNVRPVISRSNCRTVRQTCDRDGTKVPCNRQVCDVKRGPQQRVCGPVTRNRTWNGCVGSRAEPHDTRVDFGGNRVPGLINARCGAEIQTLTSDFRNVKSTIDSMSADGNTYMPAGLLWGWRTLDNRMPLRSRTTKAEKVLILMTDGNNSRSKQGEWHEFGRRRQDEDAAQRAADAKTRTLCNAIKDEDITVYTIAYEVTDRDTQTLLNNCASTQANYFNARNAAELNKAFREIGESLNELRITA